MRRIATTALLIAIVGSLLVFGTGAEDSGDEGYKVRAIFDNGAFLVPDVDVRIAGANVGSVAEVDVTGVDEAAHEDGSPDPGKAVAVLDITDEAFHDFRQDASCTVRPQSLLGDRYVDCRPTQPRAASSEPPPALEVIEDGEPGAGQRLLAVERNSKVVDLDLVNNIMREPYPDRFRLVLNDLGAGVAARGEELNEIIERANPALRQTDEVLAILAKQNEKLAQLAKDGDESLSPLASERRHLSGFINNAETTAAATAERGADLEASFQKLPAFLVELRATMTELDRFSTASSPVVSDLGDAARDLTRMTEALAPFANASIPALKSLGNAADEVGPNLVNSQPLFTDLEELAKSSRPSAQELAKLLRNFRSTGGMRQLARLIFFAAGSMNGFDSFGHILRAQIPVNNCYGYNINPEPSCQSFFTRGDGKVASKTALPPPSLAETNRLMQALKAAQADQASEDALDAALEAGDAAPAGGDRDPDQGDEPLELDFGITEVTVPDREPPADGADAADPKAMRMLLDYLVGDPASETGETR